MKPSYDKHQEQLPYHAYRDPSMGVNAFMEETMISDDLLDAMSEDELQELADLRRLYTDDPLPPVR